MEERPCGIAHFKGDGNLPSIQQVILLAALAFIVNLPLGWWRASVKKFSLSWFLAIHLAVPLIFLFRTWAGANGAIIPVLILFALIGQVIGGKLYAAD
jgi:hypothetical protein